MFKPGDVCCWTFHKRSSPTIIYEIVIGIIENSYLIYESSSLDKDHFRIVTIPTHNYDSFRAKFIDLNNSSGWYDYHA